MSFCDQLFYELFSVKATTILPIERQLERIQKENPAFYSWAKSTFVSKRTSLGTQVEKFVTGQKNMLSLKELENRVDEYLAAVQGLYKYDNSGTDPEEWEKDGSPVDKLRNNIYFYWSSGIVENEEARGINDPRYEMINILFNFSLCCLAETNRNLDGVQDRHAAEVVKPAYKTMMKAVGILELMVQLSSDIQSNMSIPFEMTPVSLKNLKSLFQAYAEELAVIKLAFSEGKEHLISAISSDVFQRMEHVISFFTTAPRPENGEFENETLERFLDFLKVKKTIMKAFCFQYYASVCNKKDENGKAIRSVLQAMEIAEHAQSEMKRYSKRNKHGKKMISRIKSISEQSDKARQSFELENTTIYHHKIPDHLELPQEKSFGSIKPYDLPPVADEWTPEVYNLFADPTKRKDYEPPPPEKDKDDTKVEKKSSEKQKCHIM
eukprot:gb/GECH01008920.1/.p1 GENE.gb/GECH01008920.1/~~gb/GECH01008920.1/.p1  ORF type:complete len:437 (+),score=109.91 gb/GECH01008920.1/:1-1311(+)